MSDRPSGTNVQGEAPDAEPVVETDEATITEDAELERTLGLTGGLAIGIGTMIGAGIFVFPGLAAGPVGSQSLRLRRRRLQTLITTLRICISNARWIL